MIVLEQILVSIENANRSKDLDVIRTHLSFIKQYVRLVADFQNIDLISQEKLNEMFKPGQEAVGIQNTQPSHINQH